MGRKAIANSPFLYAFTLSVQNSKERRQEEKKKQTEVS